MIPLQSLRNVLSDYADIYSLVTSSQKAYKFICTRVKSSLLYLLKMVIAAVVLAVVTSMDNISNNGIGFIIMLASMLVLLLGFFTFESQRGGKRFIHIGIVFNIMYVVENIIGLMRFKKLIGSKRSVLSMILFTDSKKDDVLIERYIYTYGTGEKLNKSIRAYNKKYKSEPDYINFDKHWQIAGKLYDYVNSGRASSGKEALHYYDLQEHRAKMEYEKERQNDIDEQRVENKRNEILAMEEKTRARREKIKAAAEFTDAIKNMTNTVNSNGAVSHEDAVKLTDALNDASKNLED